MEPEGELAGAGKRVTVRAKQKVVKCMVAGDSALRRKCFYSRRY